MARASATSLSMAVGRTPTLRDCDVASLLGKLQRGGKGISTKRLAAPRVDPSLRGFLEDSKG
jgi:hypothetical protein